jgi:hypothetical protein
VGGDVPARRCCAVRARQQGRGIERGSFGVVRSSEGTTNRLAVEMSDGPTITYDPTRVYGVNVYRETSREFATGDRLQFSALSKNLGFPTGTWAPPPGRNRPPGDSNGRQRATLRELQPFRDPAVRSRLRGHVAQRARTDDRPRDCEYRYRFQPRNEYGVMITTMNWEAACTNSS